MSMDRGDNNTANTVGLLESGYRAIVDSYDAYHGDDAASLSSRPLQNFANQLPEIQGDLETNVASSQQPSRCDVDAPASASGNRRQREKRVKCMPARSLDCSSKPNQDGRPSQDEVKKTSGKKERVPPPFGAMAGFDWDSALVSPSLAAMFETAGENPEDVRDAEFEGQNVRYTQNNTAQDDIVAADAIDAGLGDAGEQNHVPSAPEDCRQWAEYYRQCASYYEHCISAPIPETAVTDSAAAPVCGTSAVTNAVPELSTAKTAVQAQASQQIAPDVVPRCGSYAPQAPAPLPSANMAPLAASANFVSCGTVDTGAVIEALQQQQMATMLNASAMHTLLGNLTPLTSRALPQQASGMPPIPENADDELVNLLITWYQSGYLTGQYAARQNV